jgi:hypothetical protein
VVTIKDNEGHFYIAGQTGSRGLTSDVNTKDILCLKKLKREKKYQYFMSFPSRCLCFEKQIQDEFFSPAVLIGRKKKIKRIFFRLS